MSFEERLAAELSLYATWCGRALALSHARSECSVTLSGYMRKSDAFDRATAAFSVAYADQNEKDHDALDRASARARWRRSSKRSGERPGGSVLMRQALLPKRHTLSPEHQQSTSLAANLLP